MKKAIFSTALLALLVACSSEKPEPAGGAGSEVHFSTGVNTKTTIETRAAVETSTLPVGNQVGIYGIVANKTNMNSINWTTPGLELKENLNNAVYTAYTAENSVQDLVPQVMAKFPFDKNGALVFYAYHPYTADVVYTAGSAKTPQVPVTGKAIMAQIDDYMYVSGTPSAATKQSINLNFRHAMARMDIMIKKDNDPNTPNALLKEIRVTTRKGQKGLMNIENGNIDYVTGEPSVKIISYKLSADFKVEQDQSFQDTYARFLIIPDTDAIEQIILVLRRSDKDYAKDEEYTVYRKKDEIEDNETRAINLEKGKITTLKVNYSPADVNFSSSVSPWDTYTPTDGDYIFPSK